MSDHCPACRLVRELTEFRDQYATEWDKRRGAYNFAITTARSACPDDAREDA